MLTHTCGITFDTVSILYLPVTENVTAVGGKLAGRPVVLCVSR